MRALLPLVAAAALIAMAVAVPADATSQPPEPPVNQTPPTISGTPKLGRP